MSVNNLQLCQQINAAGEPALQTLRGKFHAHLTVLATPAQFDRLRDRCRTLKAKLTVVDLENLAGQTQTDVMATCYYHDIEEGAVHRIAEGLAGTASRLEEAGFRVIRAKLEHESTPSLPAFDERHYHEIHVKLQLPSDEYAQAYEQLLAMGKAHDFAPSRNPLDRRDNVVTQFVNKRLYQGTQADADEAVNKILAALQATSFDVVEVKRETVVFDTHQQLDQWWLP